MDKEQLKLWLVESFLDKQGKFVAKRTRQQWFENNNLPHIYTRINELTPFIPQDALKQKIHAIINDITEIPICPICNLNKKTFQWNNEYALSCPNMKCAAAARPKPKINGMHTKEGVENLKKTLAARSQKEKEETYKRKQETYKKHYGVDHYAKSVEFIEKITQTMLERYGVDSFAKTEEWRKKRALTRNPNLYNKESLLYMHHDKELTHSEIATHFGISQSSINHAMKRLGIETKYFRCSVAEKEVRSFLQQTYGESNVLCNVRGKIVKDKEIDIHIPHKNIAVEFDGLFYHSYDRLELTWEMNRHLEKTTACNSVGIKLYHILDIEWEDPIKKKIWQSMLSLEYSTVIPARKCVVNQIDNPKDFFDENHLRGNAPATMCYGLYFNDELVSAMAFTKPRFNKNYEWEMIRYASKLNHRIIGGASKLLKKFVDDNAPKSIISYADRRYSSGNLYQKLGFMLRGASKPNYCYWNNEGLHSRHRFQKHKLEAILPKFDADKSEAENMFMNGYRRFWDCGQLIFTKNYT